MDSTSEAEKGDSDNWATQDLHKLRPGLHPGEKASVAQSFSGIPLSARQRDADDYISLGSLKDTTVFPMKDKSEGQRGWVNKTMVADLSTHLKDMRAPGVLSCLCEVLHAQLHRWVKAI